MSITEIYLPIIRHYENCLKKYGATHKGVDWPNQKDLDTRYKVMLNVCEGNNQYPVSLLDLGCGYGGILQYMKNHNIVQNFNYMGIDVSENMIKAAHNMFPGSSFEVRDILKNPLQEASVDYIIMNGVITEKQSLSHDDMLSYAKRIIDSAYKACRKAIAFNIMNKTIVDWERDDLFYMHPYQIKDLLENAGVDNIKLNTDYGLYEFTAYAYKGDL